MSTTTLVDGWQTTKSKSHVPSTSAPQTKQPQHQQSTTVRQYQSTSVSTPHQDSDVASEINRVISRSKQASEVPSSTGSESSSSSSSYCSVLLYMYVPFSADSGSPKRIRCPSSLNDHSLGVTTSKRGCVVISGDTLYRPSAFIPPEGLGVVQLRRDGPFSPEGGPSDPQVAVVLSVPGPKSSDPPATDYKSTSLVALPSQDDHCDFWPTIRDDPFAFDLVHVYSVVRHTLDVVLEDLGIPSEEWRWQWDGGIQRATPSHPTTLTTLPTAIAATTTPLHILAHAGEKVNAVYHRGRRVLKFYYIKGTATSTRRTTYLCRYHDIVAHEAGHAILDAIKPSLYSSHSSQQEALHESFADLIAIFSQLDLLVMCGRVLEETGGDLSKSSSITAIGSRFATVTSEGRGRVVVGDDGEVVEELGVRNAINSAKGSTCGSNPYNIANVFSGFVWDVLVRVYEGPCFEFDTEGHRRPPPERLQVSAAAVRRVLVRGVAYHCNTIPSPTFTDISEGMVAAALLAGEEGDDEPMRRRVPSEGYAISDIIKQCAVGRQLDIAGLAKKARQDILHRLMGDF